MKSSATAVYAKFERERAVFYQDFYQELGAIGTMTVAQAISHKPVRDAGTHIGKPPAVAEPLPPSPFERVLFVSYRRIITAYKRYLIGAGFPTSTATRRLAQYVESTYKEIYKARIQEFAQRAGFYGQKAFPDFFLRCCVPVNACSHIRRLFEQLDDELLALGVQDLQPPAESRDTSKPAKQNRKYKMMGDGKSQSEPRRKDDEKPRELQEPGAAKPLGPRPPAIKLDAAQHRLGERLKKLKAESKLPWKTIAGESRVSYRWLLDISGGRIPSAATRKTIRDYFSRVLKRAIHF
jgi:hypothetical protein